jgi:hypothetical protein
MHKGKENEHSNKQTWECFAETRCTKLGRIALIPCGESRRRGKGCHPRRTNERIEKF